MIFCSNTLVSRCALLVLCLGLSVSAAQAQAYGYAAPQTEAPRNGDYILAVVNTELVTAGELQLRLNQIKAEARRNGSRLPSDEELRPQILNALIDERVQVTHARGSGQKVEDSELERALGQVAAQNQLSLPQLRERLKTEGIEFKRFRDSIRDQMLVERVRDREVQARIQISDADIDAWLEKRRNSPGESTQYNIAQVLVTVPGDATEQVLAARLARAQQALSRVQAGEPFDAVAKQMSEDRNRAEGGVIGLRAGSRLPDEIVQAVNELPVGSVLPQVLRTSAGFHVIKLLERRQGAAEATITQTHARHILLRLSSKLNEEAALQKLTEFKKQIESGTKSFEQIARDASQDGSAAQGGDLGWVSPGNFVPEFEVVMDNLPLKKVSDPTMSRFGAHLIEVLERREQQLSVKQQREQARNALREQRFEAATAEWLRELRTLAYVEMRDAPQQP